MTRNIPAALALAAALAFVGAPPLAAQESPESFAAHCRETAAAATDFAVKGAADGWLFLRSELEHLGADPKWRTSDNPAIPVIKAFRESLAEKGVALVLAPVPAKAAIYPARLQEGASPLAVPPLKPFLDELRKTGAVVVDLDAAYREAAGGDAKDPVFCATDSHWSPEGIRLAAGLIFDAVRNLDGFPLPAPATNPFRTGTPATLEITGDLTAAPGLASAAPEKLTVTRAGKEEAGSIQAVPRDAESPVVLLGDSHTMVFTDGASLGMHSDAAGIRDHLQVLFGFPLEQISNRNSGGDGARRILSQRVRANPDWWKPRKLVIWIFSEREFSQGRWR